MFEFSRATDSSEYYVSNFYVASSNINGISFKGGLVHICKSLYANMKPDEV